MIIKPLAALGAYSKNYSRSIQEIGSNKINGVSLEFQWNYDPLLKVAEAFKAYDPASDDREIQGVLLPEEVVTNQPVWDLNNSDRKDDHVSEEGAGDHNLKDAESEVVWCRRDPIAWYCPASFHAPEKYGIHFDGAKVRRLALKLEKIGGNGPSSDDWLVAAILKCFWHETCHAWVEDMCYLTQSLNGENTYTKTNNEYKCYIFMEEALCNTVALWMMKFFFQSHDHKNEIFDSVVSFMKGQPKGYRNFWSEVPQWAGQSDRISANLRKLLIEVYGFSSAGAVEHAVNTFLEPPHEWYAGLGSMSRNDFRYSGFPKFTEAYMQASNYPVYIS